MKNNYFAQGWPDEDDKTRGQHVARGYVPPGCLLGGVVLDEFVRRSVEDPCQSCVLPTDDREACGGRPPPAAKSRPSLEDNQESLVLAQDRVHESLKLRRQHQIEELDACTRGKE